MSLSQYLRNKVADAKSALSWVETLAAMKRKPTVADDIAIATGRLEVRIAQLNVRFAEFDRRGNALPARDWRGRRI